MNKDTQQLENLKVSWFIATEAAILGFFISMSANACFAIFDSGFTWRRFFILTSFSLLSFVLIDALTFIIQNAEFIRRKDTTIIVALKTYVNRKI